MVETEIVIGDEGYRLMTELTLESAAVKKQLKILSAVLVIGGLILVFLGLKHIFLYIDVLNVFYLGMAIVAFVLAFGGEKALFRKSIYRKTKEANERVGVATRKYSFDERGVSISSEVSEGIIAWSAFEECCVRDPYFLIRRKDGQYVLVNKRSLSEEKLDELKVLLAKNVPVRAEERPCK